MAGREPQSDDAARIMSTNVGLAGVPDLLGVDLPASEITSIEMDLYVELATVELFTDTLPTLHPSSRRVQAGSVLEPRHSLCCPGQVIDPSA